VVFISNNKRSIPAIKAWLQGIIKHCRQKLVYVHTKFLCIETEVQINYFLYEDTCKRLVPYVYFSTKLIGLSASKTLICDQLNMIKNSFWIQTPEFIKDIGISHTFLPAHSKKHSQKRGGVHLSV